MALMQWVIFSQYGSFPSQGNCIEGFLHKKHTEIYSQGHHQNQGQLDQLYKIYGILEGSEEKEEVLIILSFQVFAQTKILPNKLLDHLS